MASRQDSELSESIPSQVDEKEKLGSFKPMSNVGCYQDNSVQLFVIKADDLILNLGTVGGRRKLISKSLT